MKTGNLLIGLALGAVAGVITGILVAPDKGTETRKLIKNKFKDMTQKVVDTVEERIDDLESKIKNMKNKADKAADNAV